MSNAASVYCGVISFIFLMNIKLLFIFFYSLFGELNLQEHSSSNNLFCSVLCFVGSLAFFALNIHVVFFVFCFIFYYIVFKWDFNIVFCLFGISFRDGLLPNINSEIMIEKADRYRHPI